MSKKKKSSKKSNRDGKRSSSNRKGKKDDETPITQAKMFCTEAASHEKGGNHGKALSCYNLVSSRGCLPEKTITGILPDGIRTM